MRPKSVGSHTATPAKSKRDQLLKQYRIAASGKAIVNQSELIKKNTHIDEKKIVPNPNNLSNSF